MRCWLGLPLAAHPNTTHTKGQGRYNPNQSFFYKYLFFCSVSNITHASYLDTGGIFGVLGGGGRGEEGGGSPVVLPLTPRRVLLQS